VTAQGIAPQVDPVDVGLDADRLAAISAHFDGHVAAGRLPGWLCVVGRGGAAAWVGHGGHRDVARAAPVTPSSIWRIYSMTKPITAVAALQLFEQGRFDLDDELARYLPEFAAPRVYVDGPPEDPTTRPATGPIRIWHLLTHTAGFAYGSQRRTVVDKIYRLHGYDWGAQHDKDLAAASREFATMPLVFDPGSAFNYSIATDVLGRLIEVLSGTTLDDYLAANVLAPLGMHETGFSCPPSDLDRLAELYLATREGGFTAAGWLAEEAKVPPTLLSGGAGLVGTAHDYHRFATMLASGGALDGVRVAARSSIELMGTNFLPGGSDLASFAVDDYADVTSEGLGIGLGVATVIDRARLRLPVSEGSIMWGGAASTTFWADAKEALTCTFFTQLLPSKTYALRRELQRLVYPAIVA